MRENVINARLLFERFILAINFRKKKLQLISRKFPNCTIESVYLQKVLHTHTHITYTHSNAKTKKE